MKKKLSTFVVNRLIIVLFVVAAAFGASFYYLSDKISSEVNEINDHLNNLKALENKEKIVDDLNNDYQRIAVGKEAIDQALPVKDDLVIFITELEAIADSTSNLQNLSIADKVEQQNDKSVLKIEINLLGSYDSIIEYLRSLEQLRFYTKITNITFKETQYEKLSAQINTLLYVDN